MILMYFVLSGEILHFSCKSCTRVVSECFVAKQPLKILAGGNTTLDRYRNWLMSLQLVLVLLPLRTSLFLSRT